MVRNKGLIYGLCALLAAAVPLAADPGPEPDARQQTIVVRDGKVLTLDGDTFVVGKRAFLGVGLIDITSQLREHYGAPKEDGVLVGSLEPGGPAEKAGLRVGDLIVSVDGNAVGNAVDLRKSLREKKGGDPARVEVLRAGKRLALVATLVEREPAFPHIQLKEIQKMEQKLNETLGSPEWKARIEAAGSCAQLQARIKELELKLKELQFKLQKLQK